MEVLARIVTIPHICASGYNKADDVIVFTPDGTGMC